MWKEKDEGQSPWVVCVRPDNVARQQMREIDRRGTTTSSAAPTTYRINSVLASPLSAFMLLFVTRLPGNFVTNRFVPNP